MASSAALSHSSDAGIGDYFALLKPRVMSLVIFTGLIGLILAPGYIHPLQAFTAILCLSIGAGASGALNMWYDRDIDAVMKRTQKRPIPAGKIPPEEALSFGLVLSVLSVLVMGVGVNWIASGILAFTIFFYAVIYTMILKRSTPQNIVIGGAAGAFPPMIGWAAVNGEVTLASLSLFAIIFFWTPPHFWALALNSNEDFKKAKVPMMPLVHGIKNTKWQILGYSILMLPVSLTPYFIGFASLIYAAAASILSLGFILLALRVFVSDDEKSARQLFGYSIFYLFLIFLALLF